MSKRNGIMSMSALTSKKAKTDEFASKHAKTSSNGPRFNNPFMSQPIIDPPRVSFISKKKKFQ